MTTFFEMEGPNPSYFTAKTSCTCMSNLQLFDTGCAIYQNMTHHTFEVTYSSAFCRKWTFNDVVVLPLWQAWSQPAKNLARDVSLSQLDLQPATTVAG